MSRKSQTLPVFLVVAAFFLASVAQAATLHVSPAKVNPIIRTIDATANVGSTNSIAIGQDGYPVIAYYDSTNAHLKFAKCTDVTCASPIIRTVDSSASVGLHPSIAIAADGNPMIAYTGYTTEQVLTFLKCNDPTCATVTINNVDTSAFVAPDYKSLSLGSDGLPVIAYFSNIALATKVAKCNDVNCSTSTITTIDSTAKPGYYVSMVIGRDGKPLIGYYVKTGSLLKLARCNDLACTSPTISTVTNLAGQQSLTLLLMRDGNPAFIYDNNSGVMKFTKCSDIFCSATSSNNIDSEFSFSSRSVVGSDGNPVTAYIPSSNVLRFSKCEDQQCAVSSTRQVDGRITYPLSYTYLSIALGHDGYPVITYYDQTNTKLKFAYMGELVMKKSVAGKGNAPIPKTLDSTGSVGSYTSIAQGSDGYPVIAYYDETNADLKFAKCNDVDCTSTTITTLDSTGDVGRRPSVSIGRDGLPIITYYRNDFVPDKYFKLVKCNNLSCSSSTVSIFDFTYRAGETSSLKIAPDGYPVVSYNLISGDQLRVAKCFDINCTSSTTNTVDTVNGYNSSLAIGKDGYPVISYLDVSTQNTLKFVKCGNPTCTTKTIRTLGTTLFDGLYSSILQGADGMPAIASYDNTNHDLKFIHCNDLSCASTTTQLLDSTGDVGSHVSMVRGNDGFPVISYLDVSNYTLKLLKCGNVLCSTSKIVTLDTQSNPLYYSSIAMGSDGFPIISYYDYTSFDLKFIHCNAYCGSVTTIGKTQTKVVPSGLVGYWSFNGPKLSGTSAYDSSRTFATGTLTNGPKPSIGRLGQALSFDGINDYVSVYHASVLDNLTELTYSAWIKTSSTTGLILGKATNGGGFDHIWVNVGVLDACITAAGLGCGWGRATSVNTIPLNTWTHIAMTYSNSGDNSPHLYINGNEVSYSEHDTLPGSPEANSAGDYVIGGDGASNKFSGSIDEVRIYNRALSAAEIKQLYNAGK